MCSCGGRSFSPGMKIVNDFPDRSACSLGCKEVSWDTYVNPITIKYGKDGYYPKVTDIIEWKITKTSITDTELTGLWYDTPDLETMSILFTLNNTPQNILSTKRHGDIIDVNIMPISIQSGDIISIIISNPNKIKKVYSIQPK